MAKPQPSRKQTFVLIALWALTFVLLLQVMNGSKSDSKVETKDLRKSLIEANSKRKDVTAAQVFGQLNSKIDAEAKEGKLKPADAEAQKIEAGILTAEVQLRAGLERNETARIRNAYQTLWGFQKRLLDKPEWKDRKVKTFDSTKSLEMGSVGKGEWSGQELYQTTVQVLTDRNQRELIWGTIPGGYQFIAFLVNLTGARPEFSYAFAAFLLALVVRAVIFPLAQKQLMFSRQMSQLSPLANEIREKYKDNPQEQQAKVMALYQEYGINPMSGCAPALVQMPLFLTVYNCMLLYQFKFQDGTFLWINEATSKATNGFVAPNLGQQDTIMIFLYGISMVVSTLLSPVSDPNQKKQQRLMGVGIAVIFTFFMFTGAFPVVGGFVLYWTFTNVLATLQSIRAYRLPLPPLVKVNAKGGGVFPTDPISASTAKTVAPEFPWSKSRSKNGKAGPATGKSGTGKPAQHKPKK